MVQRAKELNANLGQEDAEWLLKHHDQFTLELKLVHLAFPGTIWEDPYGNCYVPYLYEDDAWLHLAFCYLIDGWHSGIQLLRHRQ